MDDDKFKQITEAADFFKNVACKFVANDGKLHAETLILSAARMAGSMMFRSFEFKQVLEPGAAVLSDVANTEGPKLMNIMLLTLQQLGHQIGENNLVAEYASAQFSPMSFKESHNGLAPFYLKYCEVAPMSTRDAALAGAMATAMLIHDCREVLSVEKSGALAVYGFIEGTKTAPFPLQTGTPASPPSPATPTPSRPSVRAQPAKPKKPWYQFW